MTDTRRTFSARRLIGALILAAMASTSSGIAQAREIIPSLGITKATDQNAGNARAYGGLALRGSVLPFLKAEGGIAYRQDSFSNGDLMVRQWPVTASLWLAPIPMLYAGGGVGWYRTTFDYRSALPNKDTTTEKVGVHLGGGANLPISPQLGLDLNGRYIFMQKDKNLNLPQTFNPDFWSTSLGLVIKF